MNSLNVVNAANVSVSDPQISDVRRVGFRTLVEEIRTKQVEVAEEYARDKFPVPVHLAIGHEWIAAALRQAFGDRDALILSHRNLHYQFAFGADLTRVIDEFRLQSTGTAAGAYGSMNLVQPEQGLVYTSSILGNNLPVSVGIGLGRRIRGNDDCVWVVTGDGAMEEGAFYESLLIAKSLRAPVVFLVEDNEWSLATSITERRCAIDLSLLTKSLSVPFFECEEKRWDVSPGVLSNAREMVAQTCGPVVVRASLTTLGGRWVEDLSREEGKRFINYHAGPIESPQRFALGVEEPDPSDYLASAYSASASVVTSASDEA